MQAKCESYCPKDKVEFVTFETRRELDSVSQKAEKGVLCLPCLHPSFNNSDNDTMKLSVNEAKLTGL